MGAEDPGEGSPILMLTPNSPERLIRARHQAGWISNREWMGDLERGRAPTEGELERQLKVRDSGIIAILLCFPFAYSIIRLPAELFKIKGLHRHIVATIASAPTQPSNSSGLEDTRPP